MKLIYGYEVVMFSPSREENLRELKRDIKGSSQPMIKANGRLQLGNDLSKTVDTITREVTAQAVSLYVSGAEVYDDGSVNLFLTNGASNPPIGFIRVRVI